MSLTPAALQKDEMSVFTGYSKLYLQESSTYHIFNLK